jgi:hypothetical protein
VRILIVGALAWNPERILALCDRGHELYGLWTRSMAWDQGPYAFARGRIRDVNPAEGVELVRQGGVDLVYSLFMAYPPGPRRRRRGEELPELWDTLRRLAGARESGRRRVPIVRHWGSDTATFDQAVVDALDGHVFCNRELHAFLAAPVRAGGLGMAIACPPERIAYLDSDRPSLAFMTDRFTPKLSRADGEIHTVCVGRPLGIDLRALARRGIHLDVYGNSVDSVALTIAGSVRLRDLEETCRAAERFARVHPSRQSIGADLEEIRALKGGWVEEFSRYDAGWSYVSSSEGSVLAARAMIPNRFGTYLVAGLPVITERLPGYHRYEALRERGIAIEFGPGDYDELAARLRDHDALAAAGARAAGARLAYSFEATLDPLLGFFERIIELGRTHAAPAVTARGPARGWPSRAALALARARARLRRRLSSRVARIKVGRLAAALRPHDGRA